MGLFHQTRTLTEKNLLIVVRRHWFSTLFRALILPIVYIWIISYVRNFFLPPSIYGFGESTAIRSARDAFEHQSGRDRIVLVNNNFTGGPIETVINDLSRTYEDAGANVQITGLESDLTSLCRSSLSGSSRCYAAVSLTGSPSEGREQTWAYTVFVDFGLGFSPNVESGENDAQIFALPLIHAIDSAVATANGQELPQTMFELPYTSQTLQERTDQVQELFMNALVGYLGLVVFIAICGITFHLPGHVAREREIGMSSLVDIMNPHKRPWLSHSARILSTNISFTIIYLPGTLGVGGVIAGLMFYRTSAGMQIVFHILSCMSLATFSTFLASFFRRAQLSGISIVILSCLLAVVTQWGAPTLLPVVATLSALFPPANYVNYTIFVAGWEGNLSGADWTRTPMYWRLSNLPGWWFFLCAAIQTVIFPLLTLWSEDSRYGTYSKMRKTRNVMLNRPQAINLVGFTKTYKPTLWRRMLFWKKAGAVHAVSNLTFAALRGQLVALLGRNGAGKSTTMAAITAQEKFTSGLIELDGGGGGVGFCPQKNVLWDELTVLEHVKIFNQLKAGSRADANEALREAIVSCDLSTKINARSKTLSGGQKRKLQLAMAFTGGSKVCCVDEASSGLDPVSRRKIWEILLAERGHRTILFTTHALDEADALADHIVMMEQGKLTMEGSPVELKQRYGGDYQIGLSQKPVCEIPAELNVRHTVRGSQHVYHVVEPSQAGRLVAFLEKQGIHDYEVNGPTIETVFLRQAEQDDDGWVEEESVTAKTDRPVTSQSGGSIEMRPLNSSIPRAPHQVLPKARKLGFLGQWWVLYRKRLTILSHSYIPYMFALAIPIVTAYLATSFLSSFELLVCSTAALADSGGFNSDIDAISLFWSRNIPVGPSDGFEEARLEGMFGDYLDSYVFGNTYTVPDLVRKFDTYEPWREFIRDNYETVRPGGLWLGNASSPAPTIAYRADGGLQYPGAVKAVSDAYLLNTTISSSFSTFALPIPPSLGDSLQLIIYFGLAMAVVPGLFALYPSYERLRNIRALQYSNGVRPGPLWLAHLAFDAFFVVAIASACLAIFVTIRPDAWYEAPHLWPVFFFYGLSATLFSYVVSLFFQTQLGAFAFAAGYQAVTLLLYFFLYLLLLAFSAQDNLQANLNAVQFSFGLITPAGCLVRALLLALNQSLIVCDGTGWMAPSAAGSYGGVIGYLVLQVMGLYAFLVMYDGGWFAGWRLNPVVVVKSLLRRNAGGKVLSAGHGKDLEKTLPSHQAQPADVLAEIQRTEDPTTTLALRVQHLTKRFSRAKEPAVDDLTFGIAPGEVYASLGPNGAGKTTTIDLIRGNLKPSAAEKKTDISITAHSLLSSNPKTRSAALLSLGVCPQFDAIDLGLSVRQHVAFYARAAGIRSREVKRAVETIIQAVGLWGLKDRKAVTLSGGNKRKLMLAIAVVGNPRVLVLDEPSSGMDAVSKRVVWRALGRVKGLGAGDGAEPGQMDQAEGRPGGGKDGMAVLITTHSMEEVAALADRVGIMRRRMLAVGTKGELIWRFGDRWHVHLLLKQDLGVTRQQGGAVNEERVKKWIETEVVGARIEREMLHGQVRFWIPRTGGVGGGSGVGVGNGGLAEVFALLERSKEELGIEYYSVVQTGLEDVFLNVVGEEDGHRD